MLPQLKSGALRSDLPCLSNGKRFGYVYSLNLSRLPRLSFEQSVIRLNWRQLHQLMTALEEMGNLGDTTVNELMVKLDTYSGRLHLTGRVEDHHRAHRAYLDGVRDSVTNGSPELSADVFGCLDAASKVGA